MESLMECALGLFICIAVCAIVIGFCIAVSALTGRDDYYDD